MYLFELQVLRLHAHGPGEQAPFENMDILVVEHFGALSFTLPTTQV